MGTPDSREHPAPSDAPAAWIRAVAAGLTAAGQATIIRETRAGLDLTTTIHQPGRRETEVILDEDGYAELHWWTDPGAPPEDTTASINRVLNASAAQAQASAVR